MGWPEVLPNLAGPSAKQQLEAGVLSRLTVSHGIQPGFLLHNHGFTSQRIQRPLR